MLKQKECCTNFSSTQSRTHFRMLHSCHILKYYLLRKCVTNRKWVPNRCLVLVETSFSPWIPRFCVFKSVRLFGACLRFIIWLYCFPLCLYDFKFHIFSYKPLHQSIATQVYMIQGYRFSRNMDILFFWEIHWTWYWEATFSLMTVLDLNFSSIFLTFHIISWSHFIF